MHIYPEERDVPRHTTLVQDEALLAELDDEADFLRGFAVVQSRELLESLRQDIAPAIQLADHEFLEELEYQFLFSIDINNLPKPFARPALFLMGRQDAAVGYRDAWKVIEQYPRASFVVLDRSGHGLGVEQKGLFQALAAEWLDRVEESVG